MGRRIIDHTGQRFGRLLVICRVSQKIEKHTRWLCRCDCGTEKVLLSDNFARKGQPTKSCGCYKTQYPPALSHGDTRNGVTSSEYRSWYAMRQRCTNPRDPRWKHYGDRGITVCDRWKLFENFLADMGRRPPGWSSRRAMFSLDRINNDGNYEPGNCRWATQKEQVKNTRKAMHV
jgi:hypothetical protein